jgi:hypothetical protein
MLSIGRKQPRRSSREFMVRSVEQHQLDEADRHGRQTAIRSQLRDAMEHGHESIVRQIIRGERRRKDQGLPSLDLDAVFTAVLQGDFRLNLTPLGLAVWDGQSAIVRILILEGGVDPTKQAALTVMTLPNEVPQGIIYTALGLATSRPEATLLVEALLSASDQRDFTTLACQPFSFFHTALEQVGHVGDAAVDAALALMAHKADPNTMNVDGANPMYLAIYAGIHGTATTKLLRALVDGGANPFQKTNMLRCRPYCHPQGLLLDGDNALALAVCIVIPDMKEHVEIMLSSDFATPASLAVTIPAHGIFHEGLQKKGELPMLNLAQLAAWDQAWENLHLLLARGVPPVSANRLSVLHFVAWSGNAQQLERLLQLPQCRALVNSLSTLGQTPLSLCCEGLLTKYDTMRRPELDQRFVDRLSCTRLLHEAGADSELGAASLTPMGWAKLGCRMADITMPAKAIVAYLRDVMGASEDISQPGRIDPSLSLGEQRALIASGKVELVPSRMGAPQVLISITQANAGNTEMLERTLAKEEERWTDRSFFICFECNNYLVF